MKIPVFFNEAMVVNRILETPSTRKPEEVVNQWVAKYLVKIVDFPPLTNEDFQLAHSKEHVEGIISLRNANGMDTRDQDVVDSLYWTTGSFYAAANFALDNGVAVSPTSGFHHAGFDFSWGFCTFNGLLIAAIKLLKNERVKKIGILDFDYHQGDGSEDIIDKLNLYSKITHLTGKANYTRERKAFFNELPHLLESLSDVDIIFYQAGADQHENDPLGGFLNDLELRERDKLVFRYARENNIPIVWNLARGYQEEINDGIRSIQKVLDIHNGTMAECADIFLSPAS